MDAKDLAHRQYLLGLLNRRMAIQMERLDGVFSDVTGEAGKLALLCACAREDCGQPLLTISSAEYDLVPSSPHRFIISPGHTTDIDEVVHVGNGFAIVEIKPPDREENPITSHLLVAASLA